MFRSAFMRGAVILFIAAFINRILGFIFQAVIFRLIGADGVGLFNLVYPIYVLLIVITTAGIPLALSKMVAEESARGNYQGARRIFHTALALLFITGFLITLIVYFSLPLLVKYVFVNKKVYICFLTMLPGVFIVALTSVFRGYFQGMQQMLPPALSQVFEQVTRVAAGLLLAYYFLPRGIEYAAAGVAAGGVLGEFCGLVVLLAAYLKKMGRYPKTGAVSPPLAKILRDLAQLCTPITGGRIVATLLLSVDTFLIPYRLKASGITVAEATSQYGLLSGVAMTMLFVPTIITIALSTTMVPAVSETMARGNMTLLRKRIDDAIKITVITGLPFLVLFYTTPGQLTDLIFGSPEAAGLLRILALGGLFLYLQQTTTGILQGLGSPTIPLINMIAASILKISCMFILTGIPEYGINGAAFSYAVFFAATGFLNIVALVKKKLWQPQWGNILIKPLFASLVMFLVHTHTNRIIFILTKSNPLAVICAGLLAGTVYLVVLAIFDYFRPHFFKWSIRG